MNDMNRLLKYAGPYKKDMILGAVLVLIETCFELFIPVMIADLIDVGVANHDIPYIYGKGLQMVFCALMALITGLLYAHFAAKSAYGWGAEIRKAEYEKVQQYAFSNLDHFETSSLVTRMTTDVTVLQYGKCRISPCDKRPVSFSNGNYPLFLDESETGNYFSGVHSCAWRCAFLDRYQGGAYVYQNPGNHGSPEPHHPGRAYRYSCGEGFCKR